MLALISSLLNELGVGPHVRAVQMGHTIDVNENVYTIKYLKRRKDAVNAWDGLLGLNGLHWTLPQDRLS